MSDPKRQQQIKQAKARYDEKMRLSGCVSAQIWLTPLSQKIIPLSKKNNPNLTSQSDVVNLALQRYADYLLAQGFITEADLVEK